MWPDAAVICMSVALSLRTCEGPEAEVYFFIGAKQRWYRERMAFRPLRRRVFLYLNIRIHMFHSINHPYISC